MHSSSRHSAHSSQSAEVVYASQHDGGDEERSDMSSEHSGQQPRRGGSEHSGEYFEEEWLEHPIDDEPISDEMLLEWTKKLDFDSYMDSWSRIATSDISEGTLPIATSAR